MEGINPQTKTLEKTVQKIPFLRLAVFLATGIIMGPMVLFSWITLSILLVLNLASLIIINLIYKYSYTIFFGFLVFTLFTTLGILVFSFHNQKPVLHNNSTFQATVLEAPQKKTASLKSVLLIFSALKNDSVFKTDEKIIVYFQEEEKSIALQPGDNIVFSGSPEIIQNRGNPYEFDYKKYLERKKIFRQIYLPAGEWQKVNTKTKFSLQIKAEQLREKLLTIFRSQQLGKEQLEILSALTLGYKRNLDPDIKTVFASSGAMHVLAVSGLHVGIIYGALFFLLGFLKRRKSGRILFVIMTLFCLWAYAFITGLSPSVERAAIMFSLLVIGENLKRRVSIYNSLAASALLLLLINPNNLFEVGFQLSYAAVFGIVFLQPKLAKLILVKTRFGRFFWTLFTVSVAAQITTFPISLYYFNQFPTYFWLTNLLVIPAISLLIPLGLALLVFAKIPVLSSIISISTNYLIYGIYFILKKIEILPFSVLHESLQPIQLIFIAGFLFSVLLLLKVPKTYFIKTALICVFLLIVSGIFLKLERLKNKEIIVYNYPENTILQLIVGKENYVLSESQIKNDYAERLITQTNKKLHLKKAVYLTVADTIVNQHLLSEGGIINFGGQTILFEQSLTVVPENYTVDFAINPVFSNKINLERTKETLVILNKSYIRNNATPFKHLYNVTREGAFQKKW